MLLRHLLVLGASWVAAVAGDALDDAVKHALGRDAMPNLGAFMTKDFDMEVRAYGLEKRVPVQKATHECTVYMWSTVSSAVTWTALNILLADGKFHLEEDISQYLGFVVRNPSFPDDPVTFRQLYLHTSSLLDGSKDPWALYTYGDRDKDCRPATSLELYVKNYVQKDSPGLKILSAQFPHSFYDDSNWDMSAAPGSRSTYANINVVVAALLVEKISDMPFDKFTHKRVFHPLGMTSSAWAYGDLQDAQRDQFADFVHASRVPSADGGAQAVFVPDALYCFVDYPSGSLIAPVGDIAKLARTLANGGKFHKGQIYDESIAYKVLDGATNGLTLGLAFAGWDLVRPGVVGLRGSETGVSCGVEIDVDHRISFGVASSAHGVELDGAFDAVERYACSARTLIPPRAPQCGGTSSGGFDDPASDLDGTVADYTVSGAWHVEEPTAFPPGKGDLKHGVWDGMLPEHAVDAGATSNGAWDGPAGTLEGTEGINEERDMQWPSRNRAAPVEHGNAHHEPISHGDHHTSHDEHFEGDGHDHGPDAHVAGEAHHDAHHDSHGHGGHSFVQVKSKLQRKVRRASKPARGDLAPVRN